MVLTKQHVEALKRAAYLNSTMVDIIRGGGTQDENVRNMAATIADATCAIIAKALGVDYFDIARDVAESGTLPSPDRITEIKKLAGWEVKVRTYRHRQPTKKWKQYWKPI